jgi:hypothetical protein
MSIDTHRFDAVVHEALAAPTATTTTRAWRLQHERKVHPSEDLPADRRAILPGRASICSARCSTRKSAPKKNLASKV